MRVVGHAVRAVRSCCRKLPGRSAPRTSLQRQEPVDSSLPVPASSLAALAYCLLGALLRIWLHGHDRHSCRRNHPARAPCRAKHTCLMDSLLMSNVKQLQHAHACWDAWAAENFPRIAHVDEARCDRGPDLLQDTTQASLVLDNTHRLES